MSPITPVASVVVALLWCGVVGAWMFIVVFLINGWTRSGYDPMRHPVSALALGRRGWVQTLNFIVCGSGTVAGAIGMAAAQQDILLGLALGLFGVALVASGIFPMDPMRGYPPGTPDGTPEQTSLRHWLHDGAGAIVFAVLPIAAAIAAFSLTDPLWRWSSGAVALVLTIGFVVFGRAWEEDSPWAGLIQRAMIITGWGWLGAVCAFAASRM